MTTVTLERNLEQRIEALEEALSSALCSPRGTPSPTEPPETDKVCMVVFSGDLDKILAALSMAAGAAAMGIEVCLFFTFWATPVLRRTDGAGTKGPTMDRVLGLMLPRGTKSLRLSRMNMGGMGPAIFKRRMRDKHFAGCEELFEMARESGVSIKVCDMSMDLMGIRLDELIDYPGLEQCGVATFMDNALRSRVTLFV